MKDTKNVIGDRIGALLSEKNKKQKDLAEYLGVTANTISYYVTGTRMPNIDQIIKIAVFFNVSTDYLLGRTEVETIDTDLKAVCNYMGLSEKSIEEIIKISKKHKVMIDCIMESGYMQILVRQLVKKQDYINNILNFVRDNDDEITSNTKANSFSTAVNCIIADGNRDVSGFGWIIDDLINTSKNIKLKNNLSIDTVQEWYDDLEYLEFVMNKEFDRAIHVILIAEHEKNK